MSGTSINKDGNQIDIEALQTVADVLLVMQDPVNANVMGALIARMTYLNSQQEAELAKLSAHANAKEILGFPGIVQVPALQDNQFAYSGPLHEIKFKNAGEVFNFFSKYESLLSEEGTSVTISFRGRRIVDGIQTGVKAGQNSVFKTPFVGNLYEVVNSAAADNSIRKITVRR
jgi:hypothetical protein